MHPESAIFKYQKGKKVSELLIIVLIAAGIVFILESDGDSLTRILLTILMTGFLAFMVSYTYLLNEHIEVTTDSIKIKKKIGKSIKIPFNEIRRVTIRVEENSVEIHQLAMTIFGKSNNTKIIVSDLDNPPEVINLIEEKGKDLGFNVIHQNPDGQVVKSLN